MNTRTTAVAAGLCLMFLSSTLSAETNSLGMPGHVSVPMARPFADAELAMSLNLTESQRLGGLTFQISPRLTGAFRYGRLESGGLVTYDRSFDLQYQILTESVGHPGIAIGLRDFIGTGQLSSEYIVATTRLRPALTASIGLGWGKLGAAADFPSIFSTTRPASSGLGGELGSNQWFRGPAAIFAGLDWQVDDRLRVSLDYSGEDPDGSTGPKDPGVLTLGASYLVRPGLQLTGRVDDGGRLGFGVEYRFDPGRNRRIDAPALPRVGAASDKPTAIATALRGQGIVLQGLEIRGRVATLRVENRQFGLPAQALGRTARVLVAMLPETVDTFVIEAAGAGPAAARLTLTRAELSGKTGFDAPPWREALLSPAQPWTAARLPEPDKFSTSLKPYLAFSLFDPDSPVRADFGLQAETVWRIAPNLRLDAVLRARLLGNRAGSDRLTDSTTLPPVRSDAVRYTQEGDISVPVLTLTHNAVLGHDLYSRASFGLLEEMFAGVSAEVLWKPVASRLAIGIELAHVWQRDPGFNLGFDYYDYDVTTGHVSFYYAVTPDYEMRLDVGRYLAGDLGATLAVERRFANGWKIGAYATKTDVSAADFGEGSFDKGIYMTIPVDWLTGTATPERVGVTLQPILRDGGARLALRDRLYESIRPGHALDLSRTWDAAEQ